MEYKNEVKFMIDLIQNNHGLMINEVRDILTSIENAIKKFLKDDPNLSKEELNARLNNLMSVYISNKSNNQVPLALNQPTRSDLYLYKTLETIIKHPNILKDILSMYDMKKILDNTDSEIIYTSNISKNYETYLKDIFLVLRDKLPKEILEKLYNDELSIPEKVYLQQELMSFTKRFNMNFYDKVIRTGTINKIVIFSEILDRTNLLPKNNNYNNLRLQSMDMSFMGFNYFYNKEDDINRPFVSSLLNPNLYTNYKIEELFGMCAFYANRASKAISIYNNGLYILYKTDLLKKYIENPDYKINLSNQEIKNILTQKTLLDKPCGDFIKSQHNEEDDKPYEVTDSTIYQELNNPIIKQALRKYNYSYSDEFNKLIPNCNHDLLEDLNENLRLNATTSYAYSIKYNAIESLIFMLMEKGKDLNWGIVLDTEKDESPENIVIGIDLKEFNMPIKLHCSKEKILEFVKNYSNNSIIPVYEGNEDMKIHKRTGDKFYGTQILLKLSKDQRKILRKKADEITPDNTYYKFVKHINWMSLPKRVPEFLLNENNTFVKRYYDLEKNKIYTEKYLEELKSK